MRSRLNGVSLLAAVTAVALLLSGCGTRQGRVATSSEQTAVAATTTGTQPYGAAPTTLTRPDQLKAKAGLALTLVDLKPGRSRGGPEVEKVPAGDHSTAGMQIGDVILAIANAPVKTSCDVVRRLETLTPYTWTTIEFLRGTQLHRASILLSASREVTGC